MNKFSEINIINNATTRPHIIVNGDGIADSGSILNCYRRFMPTDNDCLDTAFHVVQPDGSQIVSTLQANIKVSTLNKEARRRCKFPTLTQNLVSFPVLAKQIFTISSMSQKEESR